MRTLIALLITLPLATHALAQNVEAVENVENKENVALTEEKTDVHNNLTINVTEIAESIAKNGSAAIYGLEFAFNSAEILPASEPVLEAMASYLVGSPSQTILLVGHTDNVGGLDVNLTLSQKRAEAVMDALTGQYKIPVDQLQSHGVGYLAPVASNTTDEGRAKNRRVEMVPR